MKNKNFTSVATTCLVALLGGTHSTGWAKPVEEKVKNWIDDSSQALKKGVDKLGDDFQAIQDYLNNYPWKGIVQEKAVAGPVVLRHLELNDHSRAVVVKPGERVEAEVQCNLDPEKCSIFGMYRIVVGIQGIGAQASIGNELGLTAGKTIEHFSLIAPSQPGVYEVRFRVVDSLFKGKALDSWRDEKGNEPDAKTTIGMIVVKP